MNSSGCKGASDSEDVVRRVFRLLEEKVSHGAGWPDGDWPVRRKFTPAALEIVVGAVLTQNTAWRNAERALDGLAQRGLTSVPALLEAPLSELEGVLRPSGYFRQKARRLRSLLLFIRDYPDDFFLDVDRAELLEVQGVGPETADSILLYGCSRPVFVVDAYTLRLFARLGLLDPAASYARAQEFFHRRLASEATAFKLFHALIVEHSKSTCLKIPHCSRCVLREMCPRAAEAGSALQPRQGG